MNKEEYQEHFENLFEYYCNQDNTIIDNNIEVAIKVVDNMYEEILKCDLTEEEIESTSKVKQYIDNQTGHILCPNKNRDSFVVLIHIKQFEKDFLYVQTLFHELTHIIDYYKFTQKYCNGNYDKIDSQVEHGIFLYWTEYNAKKIGYKLYRQYMHDNCDIDMNSNEVINHMKTTELECQNKNLMQQLQDNSSDLVMQIYFIMHYLARYNVWEEIENQYYKDGCKFPYWLNITCNGKIYELYDLMKKINNFEIFTCTREDLEKLLNDMTK